MSGKTLDLPHLRTSLVSDLPVRFLPSLLVSGLLLASSAAAAPFTAFRDGETFTYRVGFAFFSHAGDIIISAKDDRSEGRDHVLVTTDTRSNGFVRGLYAFDNLAVVRIDRPTSRLLEVRDTGADPKRATDNRLEIDYTQRLACYTDKVRPEKSLNTPLPEGDPIDLISALVQTREWNLKPGEHRDVVVNFEEEFYELAIYADHYEEVRTPLGRYKTLVLIPVMEKNPKGLFKRGGQIKVWIAQDGSRLPVKMQLKLKIGSATLLLAKYDGAAPGNAPATAPATKPGTESTE